MFSVIGLRKGIDTDAFAFADTDASSAATFTGNLNDFTGNVRQLTEPLGIPIEQVQPNSIPDRNQL
jgi:hypothetical protein